VFTLLTRLSFPRTVAVVDGRVSRFKEHWMRKRIKMFFLLAPLFLTLACSHRDNVSYKDDVKKALEQADLKDVTVSEDQDKNTITLGGKVHSSDAKAKAVDVAKTAANTRIIANEISVQPVGSESQAKDVASNLDDGIEKDYKAALISSGLDKQHVRFKANNRVLTLTGNVHNTNERQQAERLAAGIPNVQQVLNQIEVRR
jgi:osmotically-inducible protein OsmY